jgi:hypothetical protein
LSESATFDPLDRCLPRKAVELDHFGFVGGKSVAGTDRSVESFAAAAFRPPSHRTERGGEQNNEQKGPHIVNVQL